MAKPRLGEIFPLRLSKAQRATLDENSEAAGLTRAEFLRREAGLPTWGRRDRSAVEGTAGSSPLATSERGRKKALGGESGLEKRTKELAKTMPWVNAERLARREFARDKARAALEDAE